MKNQKIKPKWGTCMAFIYHIDGNTNVQSIAFMLAAGKDPDEVSKYFNATPTRKLIQSLTHAPNFNFSNRLSLMARIQGM